MCEFISDTNVMPGYVCCACRTYNGLQRRECRGCGRFRHDVEIPAGVLQCIYCEFAYEERHKPMGGKCPVCGSALPVVATVEQLQ